MDCSVNGLMGKAVMYYLLWRNSKVTMELGQGMPSRKITRNRQLQVLLQFGADVQAGCTSRVTSAENGGGESTTPCVGRRSLGARQVAQFRAQMRAVAKPGQ